jgi:RecB family exonuclease
MQALDMDRFIAWDDFKSLTLSVQHREKRPATGASRIIFAAALLKENALAAAAGKSLLSEIVSPSYAADYSPFVSSLALRLPALETLGRRLETMRKIEDPYFADMLAVRDRYALFLADHGLYEPSWDRTPFRETADRWVLFFPELADDWEEYSGELSSPHWAEQGRIRIVPLDRIGAPTLGEAQARKIGDILGTEPKGSEGRGLIRFDDYREELRWVASTIRVLLDQGGLAPSDIILSIPDSEEYAERLALECKLRDVPGDGRLGKSLLDHPGGRFLSALPACPGSHWSFRALKDLLLDRSLPWKDRPTIDALIEFGLRFRCVSGYIEQGVEVDVWERSFERLEDQEVSIHLPVGRIRSLYRRLKRDISDAVRAETFSELREKLLMFISNHLERSEMAEETDSVLSRALEELSVLAETENLLKGLAVPDPYGVFQTHLRSVQYVFQAGVPGVRFYKYRVAAGIGSAVHFILNMTQNDANIRVNPASFLREDRRLALGLEDRDLSGTFIHAYRLSGGFCVFTAADRTAAGHGVPHRCFSVPPFSPPVRASDLPQPTDSVAAEMALADGYSLEDPREPSALQRTGWQAARRTVRPAVDFRVSPVMDVELRGALSARLTKKDEKEATGDKTGTERLSPTDLNEYTRCPFAWLLQRGLGIRDKQTEIETIDQRDLGILYHRILERFFLRIKDQGGRFRLDAMDQYRDFLAQEVRAALEERSKEEGAFQESVYAMLETRVYAALADYLEKDAEILNGSTVVGAEHELHQSFPGIGPALGGIADLILVDRNGDYVLTDFKTGQIPKAADLLPDQEDRVENLQMAAYVGMLESDGSGTVKEARFYSLDNRAYQRVISEQKPTGRSPLPVAREAYQNPIDLAVRLCAAMDASLRCGEYAVPKPKHRWVCASCRVASVCRLPFSGGEA